MSKKASQYMILGFGALLLFAGVFTLFIALGNGNTNLAEYVVSGIVLFFGTAFCYVYAAFFRKTFYFVVGCTSVLSGILLMTIKTGLVDISMLQFWPFVVFFSSISVFISGKIKRSKKLSIAYDFTAFFLLVMSILYSLFSFEIFPVSFKQVMYITVPSLLIAGGFFLVFLFIHRQKINDILKNENLESDDDGESETF